MKDGHQQFLRDFCIERGTNLNEILEACFTFNDNQGAYFSICESNSSPDNLFEGPQFLCRSECLEKRCFSHLCKRPSYLRLKEDNENNDSLCPETLYQPVQGIELKVS